MQYKGYDSQFLERLKEKCDIISVVSKYLTLEKKGKTYWACCPFHFEKTPSFAINEVEQYYHCFGCGESGDVIKFVQKYESQDFASAIKTLAKSVGMELPEFVNNDELVKQNQLKEKLYTICNLAKDFFSNNLKLPQSKPANDYLQKRGMDAEIIEKFAIGCSIGWTTLIEFLNKKGYSNSTLLQAGVADTKNGRTYDVMANRLLFPIINQFGDCIGFTGRTLEANATFAKYRNTAQTIIFDKSRAIYNIYNIKQLKKDGLIDNIIIAEGTIDVIAFYKAGLKNAVACLGTAITPLHAKELKKFTNQIILCLDGDSAGQKATFRAIDILLESGLDVKVVSLKENLDPDEFLKKYGKDALVNAIKNTQIDALDFKIISISKKYNLANNYDRTKFIKEGLEIVNSLQTSAERDIYLKQISKLSNVSIDVLRRDVLLPAKQAPVASNQTLAPNYNEIGLEKAIKFVLASLLHKKDFALSLANKQILFKNPDYQKLFDFIKSAIDSNQTFTVSNVFDMFETEQNPNINDIINFNFNSIEGDQEKYYYESLNKLYDITLQQKQEQLMLNYKNETDLDKRRQIVAELNLITKELKNRKTEN